MIDITKACETCGGVEVCDDDCVNPITVFSRNIAVCMGPEHERVIELLSNDYTMREAREHLGNCAGCADCGTRHDS